MIFSLSAESQLMCKRVHSVQIEQYTVSNFRSSLTISIQKIQKAFCHNTTDITQIKDGITVSNLGALQWKAIDIHGEELLNH